MYYYCSPLFWPDGRIITITPANSSQTERELGTGLLWCPGIVGGTLLQSKLSPPPQNIRAVSNDAHKPETARVPPPVKNYLPSSPSSDIL